MLVLTCVKLPYVHCHFLVFPLIFSSFLCLKNVFCIILTGQQMMSISLPSLYEFYHYLLINSFGGLLWSRVLSGPFHSMNYTLWPQISQPLSLICPSYQELMTRLPGTAGEGRQPLRIPMIIVPWNIILQEQTTLFFFFLMTQKNTKLPLFSQETKWLNSIRKSCLNHETAAFLGKMSFSALLHHLAPSCLIACQLHLCLRSFALASVHTHSAA